MENFAATISGIGGNDTKYCEVMCCTAQLPAEFAAIAICIQPTNFTDHEDWEGNIVEGSWRAGSDSLPGMGDLTTMSGYHSARTAMDMRNHLATYFMNEGRVPWQERIVTRAGIQKADEKVLGAPYMAVQGH